MIDWEKHHKKLADLITKKLKINTDPTFSKRFRKFCNWWLYKLPPIFTSISSFIVLIWIFKRIRTKYGVEDLTLIFFAIVVFSLRQINKEVSKLNEK